MNARGSDSLGVDPSLFTPVVLLPFSLSGPDAWNSLSGVFRGIAVASTFKCHLKDELSSRAYGISLAY